MSRFVFFHVNIGQMALALTRVPNAFAPNVYLCKIAYKQRIYVIRIVDISDQSYLKKSFVVLLSVGIKVF